jgi:hypothetical protein
MASTTTKVFVGGPDRVTGTLLYAPAGTDCPVYADAETAVTDTLDAAFRDVGFLGEDGVTKSEGLNFATIKEYGGKTIARIRQDYNASFQLTVMEYNANVAKMLYGDDNVTVVAASATHGEIVAVRAGGPQPNAGVFVLRMIGLNDQRTLISVPNGQITTIGDQQFSRTAAAAHQVTIETLPDENGYDFYLFADDRVIQVAAVPTLTSALPAGRSVGEQIVITGTRFAAGGTSIVTAITIDGVTVPADTFTVIDANTIVATIPTGAAGASPIVVTNTTGASTTPLSYTVI